MERFIQLVIDGIAIGSIYGALALAVEIHTARENWADAVEVLNALATAKFVPEAQRRLARLGGTPVSSLPSATTWHRTAAAVRR